eukprot:196386_1
MFCTRRIVASTRRPITNWVRCVQNTSESASDVSPTASAVSLPPQQPLAENLNAKRLALSAYYGRSSVSGIKATVFGCNGHVGSAVVNSLGRIGSRVTCPYRDQTFHGAKHLKVAGDLGQIHLVHYDPRDMEQLKKLVRGSTVVVNCCGGYRESRNYSYYDVNVNIPKALAIAAREEGVSQFIHVSMLGAHLDHDSVNMATKAEGELELRKIFPEAVIMRPAINFGKRDGLLFRMSRMINKRYSKLMHLTPGIPTVNLGQKIQPVHRVDVSNAIMQAIKHAGETAGKTYELCGPDVYTQRQIWERLAEFIQEPVNVYEVKQSTLEMFGSIANFMSNTHINFCDDEVRILASDQLPQEGSLRLADLNLVSRPLASMETEIMQGQSSGMRHEEWGSSDSVFYLQKEYERGRPYEKLSA